MKKNLNVVLVSPFPPPAGGIALWAVRYLKYCPNFGINCSHVNTAYEGQVVFGDSKKIGYFKQFKRAKNIWKNVTNKIRENNAEILHICIPATFKSILRELITVKKGNKLGVKTIIHFRSTVSQSASSFLGKVLLKKICKIVDGIIVLNNYSYEYVSKYCEKEKISIIPNFIDGEEIVEQFNVKEKIKTISYVGGVVEEKGCKLLIEFAKNHQDIEFNLIGSSSEKIRDSASELNNVRLINEQPKEIVKEYLKNSDVFMFLSKYKMEGFSNALLEAMATGLPCIATKWASNELQLGDYSDKVTINIDSLEELESAFKFLLSQENRNSVSKYNLERSKLFETNNIMSEYKGFYEKIMNYGK